MEKVRLGLFPNDSHSSGSILTVFTPISAHQTKQLTDAGFTRINVQNSVETLRAEQELNPALSLTLQVCLDY